MYKGGQGSILEKRYLKLSDGDDNQAGHAQVKIGLGAVLLRCLKVSRIRVMQMLLAEIILKVW